jgi:diguanylate cyclase (GGDEF)-like protein
MHPMEHKPARIDRVRSGVHWMYGLVAIPFVTDLIETGTLPLLPREWITEIVAGLVIAALVHRVHTEHVVVLAQAQTDALTALWNRRAFEMAVDDECRRARRSGQALTLVYMDIDGFKQINDRQGHQRGDQVLKEVAAALREAGRARVDRAFRLGGDEFALLLPGSTAAQAESVVARSQARCRLGDAVQSIGGVALSAGIVELGAAEDAHDFVRRADTAMYRHKNARR